LSLFGDDCPEYILEKIIGFAQQLIGGDLSTELGKDQLVEGFGVYSDIVQFAPSRNSKILFPRNLSTIRFNCFKVTIW
jgi:hypothetical protein